MKFGAHVSIAEGIINAPKRASAVGAEVFQIFTKSPHGGKATPITDSLAEDFRLALLEYHQYECYVHTPYYINFASSNNRIKYGSISAVRDDLERASKLGARYVMTHLGSARDLGRTEALRQVGEGISKALRNYRGTAELLLELTAGTGLIVGDTFAEMKKILNSLSKPAQRKCTGVCFDTCHVFASGYDLRTPAAVSRTMANFAKELGLGKLKLFHFNDSKTELGSHRDRHEHIGQGKIGRGGFTAIINFAKEKLPEVNAIIETPYQSGKKDPRDADILTLIKLRDKK